MRQEVLLAMLAKEPSYGYELHARLNDALGALGEVISEGQIYVTLGRLEKAGLVAAERAPEPQERAERKMYSLTPAGQLRVTEWLAELSWPKPDVSEFYLKLEVAAEARMADPIALIDTQRRSLIGRLRDAQEAAMTEPNGSRALLLLEGIILRLQADLKWLESCDAAWTAALGNRNRRNS
jgi:DNA-binding PadR family transcriptional regulator